MATPLPATPGQHQRLDLDDDDVESCALGAKLQVHFLCPQPPLYPPWTSPSATGTHDALHNVCSRLALSDNARGAEERADSRAVMRRSVLTRAL